MTCGGLLGHGLLVLLLACRSLRLQEGSGSGVATKAEGYVLTLLLLHLLKGGLLLSLLLYLALLGLDELIAWSTSVARWEAKQTQLLCCGAWCS